MQAPCDAAIKVVPQRRSTAGTPSPGLPARPPPSTNATARPQWVVRGSCVIVVCTGAPQRRHKKLSVGVPERRGAATCRCAGRGWYGIAARVMYTGAVWARTVHLKVCRRDAGRPAASNQRWRSTCTYGDLRVAFGSQITPIVYL